jgi:dipeptidyl aminopeptidase/acylaminoacyl peptidase
LPPVLVVQPERDQNVPVFMSQTLVGAYQMAGGDVTYRLFPGMHHGFGQADIPEADDCADAMVSFIQRFG